MADYNFHEETIIENGEEILKVQFRGGNIAYYQNGNYHRINGPAISFEYGNNLSWYYRGMPIPVKSQEEFEKYLKLLAFV